MHKVRQAMPPKPTASITGAAPHGLDTVIATLSREESLETLPNAGAEFRARFACAAGQAVHGDRGRD